MGTLIDNGRVYIDGELQPEKRPERAPEREVKHEPLEDPWGTTARFGPKDLNVALNRLKRSRIPGVNSMPRLQKEVRLSGGKVLKEARLHSKMSRIALARASGVPQRRITQMEIGHITNLLDLANLCVALGLTLDEVIPLDEEPCIGTCTGEYTVAASVPVDEGYDNRFLPADIMAVLLSLPRFVIEKPRERRTPPYRMAQVLIMVILQDLTYEEVGEYFDVTAARIQQIKERGLRKLKHPRRSKRLKSYPYSAPTVSWLSRDDFLERVRLTTRAIIKEDPCREY